LHEPLLYILRLVVYHHQHTTKDLFFLACG
jgi:hypothetical protein